LNTSSFGSSTLAEGEALLVTGVFRSKSSRVKSLSQARERERRFLSAHKDRDVEAFVGFGLKLKLKQRGHRDLSFRG
jgi:hypothetical protein